MPEWVGPAWAFLGSFVAGGAGGWVGVLLTNRAAGRRQKSDHEHAVRLAEERIEVETTAALRAERTVLYLELMEVIAPLHNGLIQVSLLCNPRAELTEKRVAALDEKTTAFVAARKELDAMRPRILLVAGPTIREYYGTLCQMTGPSLWHELELVPFEKGQGWNGDVDGEDRRRFKKWWAGNASRFQELSDQLHDAMRADVLPPSVLRTETRNPWVAERSATGSAGEC